jgi:nicotinamidase-related amidase
VRRDRGKQRRPSAKSALLLIDVINPFTFDGATALLRFALPAARRIRALKERARAAQLPIVYVNDNFGQWQSDFRSTVRHCATSGRAAEIVTLLRPQADDYFVLKPRHSGFYLTPLEMLLHDLRVNTLILTGFATNMCVLFTAADAHMRYFALSVPSDCVAAERADLSRSALDHMRRAFGADTRRARALPLGR